MNSATEPDQLPAGFPLTIEQVAELTGANESKIRSLAARSAFPVEQAGPRGTIRVLYGNLDAVRAALEAPKPARPSKVLLDQRIADVEARVDSIEARMQTSVKTLDAVPVLTHIVAAPEPLPHEGVAIDGTAATEAWAGEQEVFYPPMS